MIYVTKTTVNLRDAKSPKTVIILLGKGEEVELFERTKHTIGNYILSKCKTRFGEGLIAADLLVEKTAYIKPCATKTPHILSRTIVDKDDPVKGRISPIDTTKEIMSASTYESRFAAVKSYLQVKKSLAFQPNKFDTFCNIYAYQFAQLMANFGGFIPRVWFNTDKDKENGVVEYAKTVHELNANALYTWFLNYGKEYGWRIGKETDAETHLTIAVVMHKSKTIQRKQKNDTTKDVRIKGIGHIAVINPDGKTTTEAGRECYYENPNWKRWFNAPKYDGRLIWTTKP